MHAADGLRVNAKRDKLIATITVNLKPRAEYRHLYVIANSENVFASKYQQLEGEKSLAQYRFEIKVPDDGIYDVEAQIQDSMNRVLATAMTRLITMPPNTRGEELQTIGETVSQETPNLLLQVRLLHRLPS